MAQFDVYRNTGKHKDTIPFVVVVQSAQFDRYRRRVVVPLVRTAAIGKISYVGFNPTFKIRGISVVLHPLEIVSVPVDQLGEIVGSLGEESQLIVAALDELLTRAWK
ncbi:MAG TPA: CcdB family protein [Steroidobacteraceae bacterium]|jgi:toxin CcdB|nr:CcdB family protein [Steroidobacteraceae bacterium]